MCYRGQRTLYPWMREWSYQGGKLAERAVFTQLFADANVFVCQHRVSTPDGPRDERQPMPTQRLVTHTLVDGPSSCL